MISTRMILSHARCSRRMELSIAASAALRVAAVPCFASSNMATAASAATLVCVAAAAVYLRVFQIKNTPIAVTTTVAESREKHQHRPQRHVLLGFQIGYFALLLSLACYLVLIGYKIADRGVDHIVEGSRKVRGTILFWSGILLACGAALLLPLAGYWMAFEGGVDFPPQLPERVGLGRFLFSLGLVRAPVLVQ